MKTPTSLPRLLLRVLIIFIITAALYFAWQWLLPIVAPDAVSTNAPAEISGLTTNINDGDVFNEPILDLTGMAFPERQLLINGQPIPVNPDGSFTLTLRLTEGPNLIILETSDEAGNTISLIRQITYSLPNVAPPEEEIPVETYSGMLGLALLVILSAVIFALLRRRKPWIRLTTDTATFRPQSIGTLESTPLTIIVELDRETRLSLFVTDPDGKRFTTLLNNRRRSARRHTFNWNGYGLSGEVAKPGKVTIIAVAGVPPAKIRAKIEVEILHNPDVHD